jgi:hypothetical protein
VYRNVQKKRKGQKVKIVRQKCNLKN